MEDSILDIDEALLSDSFMYQPADESSFDDITKIVQQWKQAESESTTSSSPSSSNAEDKFLNTRTFTRPKKKVYPKCSPNMFNGPGTPSAAADKQMVNLKIGGLVTSMQRSFLGDVSPPSSLCSTSFSSSSMLGASLINSSDFTNLNYFMESTNTLDPAISRQPPPYIVKATPQNTITPAAAEQFERLFDTSRPTFDGESMLNSMCMTESTANTVESFNQTITLSEGLSSLGDATFVEATPTEAANETLTNGHSDDPNQVNGELNANATYDNIVMDNRTLLVADAPNQQRPMNVTVNAISGKPSSGVSGIWGRTLGDTFQLDQVEMENVTFELSTPLTEMEEKGFGVMDRTMDIFTDELGLDGRPDYGYQSTPIKPAMTKTNEFIQNINFSPIAVDPKQQSNLNTTSTIANDFKPPSPPPVQSNTQPINIYRTYARPSRTAVQAIAEQSPRESLGAAERQSLTNFEEFERSQNSWPHESAALGDRQSLTNFEEFEKCQTEQDLDQMLNKLSQSDQIIQKDQLMRQSLENIKNRHLATNLEKQQEDQRRKQPAMDRSTNSMLTSSGSGERLLRRSRLCDDVSNDSASKTMSTSTLSDTKENVQCNFDITRDTNRITPDSNSQTPDRGSTDNVEPTHLVPKSSIPSSNRDRFKTIRISKRPLPADTVPHIHDEYGDTDKIATEDEPVALSNGPSSLQTDNRTVVEGVSVPRRRLTRPSQLNGLVRRDASLGVQRTIVAPSVVKIGAGLTSPMGCKAKSIHNLATGYEKSAAEVDVGNRKEKNQDNFKVPSSLPAVQRMRVAKRSGLIRPSSGYYSFNVRRNDSDTESGRMSPTTSLSSGSSKGSLYKGDLASSADSSEMIKIELQPLADDVHQPPRQYSQPPSAPPSTTPQPPPTISAASVAKPIKRSGIQPPSTFAAHKRSGLPRPMSMANR